jgi:alpha-tubulin suppressor-like RCC1 family protein
VQRGALFALLTACAAVTPLDGSHLRARPNAIDLGYADCGGASPSADWVVENDGTAPLEVTATTDPRLSLDQTHFFVDAHASTTVHIEGPAAAKDAHAGETTHALMHVTTNDDNPPFDIDVTTTTHGAALELVPEKIDLGLVPVGIASPPHGFALANAGNADADVSLSQPNPDFMIALDTLHVAGDQTVQGTATFFASAPGATKTTVAIVAKGVLCGDVPKLEVLANGSEGVFGVSPGLVDFGSIYCGHAAKPKTLTLINGGNTPYAFTATLASGNGFHVSPSSGVVTKTLDLTITPLPVPKNAIPSLNDQSDTLTITTNIPDDPPHAITIQQFARGAFLRFASPTDSFGKVDVGKDVTHSEPIINDGSNETISFGSATSGDFSLAQSYGVEVTFHPDPKQLGTKETATFTLDVIGPTCGDAPVLTVDATPHDVATSVVALDDATCASSINYSTDYTVRVYCWGSNAAQQLGTTAVTGALAPRFVDTGSWLGETSLGGGGTYVAASFHYSTVDWGTVNGVTMAPTLRGWSTNSNGRGVVASVDVACMDATECWGKGGDLGDGTTNDSSSFVYVPVHGDLDVGYDGHSCGRGYDTINNVFEPMCWGPDDWGQIGDGNSGTGAIALSPTQAANLDWSYQNIAAGGGFTCAYSYQTLQTVCFGRNTSGECGATPSSSPVLVPNVVSLGAIESMDAGRDFTCALLSTYGVSCWGANNRGQLGDGALEVMSSTPVTVGVATTVSSYWWYNILSAGNRHACVVLSDGRLQCWGSNTYGEIGDGTTNDATSPVFVKGFD